MKFVRPAVGEDNEEITVELDELARQGTGAPAG